jgi:hypothetical protein
MPESAMSRSEMVRQLDEAAVAACDLLGDGPLSPEEQHVVAATLEKLLPLVAESIQDQLDTEAAAALLRRRDEHG